MDAVTKKMFIVGIVLLLAHTLISGRIVTTKLSSFPGTNMVDCQYFTIGDCIYINGGVNFQPGTGEVSKEMWEYNTKNDIWSQKKEYPSKGRKGGIGFSILGKGYVVLGGDGIPPRYTSCWEYNPVNDSWIQKANFPGKPRSLSSALVLNNKAYIVGGQYNDGSKNTTLSDVWEFDPKNNSWKQKKEFPGNSGWGSFNFVIDSLGYVGQGQTGITTSFPFFLYNKSTWCYNPSSDTWDKVNTFNGNAVSRAIGFSLSDTGFWIGGSNANLGETVYDWFLKDIYQLDKSNAWTKIGSFNGSARTSGIGVTVDNKFYYGLGGNILEQFTDLWSIEISTD